MKKTILLLILLITLLTNAQDTIIKKEPQFDGWKAAGVTYFFASYAGLVISPSLNLETDKYLHGAVGYISGVSANLFIHKYTRSKLLGLLGGFLMPAILGGSKELADKHLKTGTYSKKDFWATTLSGAFGSIGATIVIGCKYKHDK